MDKQSLLPILSTPINHDFEDELLHSDLAACLQAKQKLAFMFGRFNSNIDNRFGILLNCKAFHYQYRIQKFQKTVGQKTFIELYEQLFPHLTLKFNKKGAVISGLKVRSDERTSSVRIPTEQEICDVYHAELSSRIQREKKELQSELRIRGICERHAASVKARSTLSRPSVTHQSSYDPRILAIRHMRQDKKRFNSEDYIISLQHFFVVEDTCEDVCLRALFREPSTGTSGVVKLPVCTDLQPMKIEHLRVTCDSSIDIAGSALMEVPPTLVSGQSAIDEQFVTTRTLDVIDVTDRRYDIRRVDAGWRSRCLAVLRWLQPVRLKIALRSKMEVM